MDWQVDKTSLIELLGKTIYRPENVLVEMAANSYDADASIVRINSSGENQVIQIIDNGSGMDRDDIDTLITIAKSKKRKLIEEKQKTPKYSRQYLGSFGIGIISFLSLGNRIKIFSKKNGQKTLFLEIERTIDAGTNKTVDIKISEIQESLDFINNLIDGDRTDSGTTIEITNNKLEFSHHFRLLKHKLSNLPLNKDFVIELNGSQVTKDDYPTVSWLNRDFELDLVDIDPNYKSKVSLHAYYSPDNPYETIDNFKRGIFFRVHGRVVENNVYQKIRSGLTSPGTVDARLTGYVEADYLFSKIQANREDFFENAIVDRIAELLAPEVQKLINDYLLLKNYVSEEAYITEFNRQKVQATERIQNKNDDLVRLGIKFKYKPETEQELVLIISELCQKNILPFEIIRISGASHIDCFVKWPLKQEQRDPDFVGHLEIETSAHKFFVHQHDYRTKPEICCWDVDPKSFESETKKYMQSRPESIESVELIEPSTANRNHFGHQKEIHVKIKKKHDEFETKILRVYIVNEIIKTAKAN